MLNGIKKKSKGGKNPAVKRKIDALHEPSKIIVNEHDDYISEGDDDDLDVQLNNDDYDQMEIEEDEEETIVKIS